MKLAIPFLFLVLLFSCNKTKLPIKTYDKSEELFENLKDMWIRSLVNYPNPDDKNYIKNIEEERMRLLNEFIKYDSIKIYNNFNYFTFVGYNEVKPPFPISNHKYIFCYRKGRLEKFDKVHGITDVWIFLRDRETSIAYLAPNIRYHELSYIPREEKNNINRDREERKECHVDCNNKRITLTFKINDNEDKWDIEKILIYELRQKEILRKVYKFAGKKYADGIKLDNQSIKYPVKDTSFLSLLPPKATEFKSVPCPSWDTMNIIKFLMLVGDYEKPKPIPE